MKKCSLVVALLLPLVGWSQTGSEIWLFNLREKRGKITATHPINITNHPGYDNQPSFHPQEPIVYYSSFNDQGRADIKSYNYKTKATAQITTTNEREYSPTITPDQTFISCIIQRDNGAQDLGKYPVDGGDPAVIVDHLTVGYHVWADNSHLALFVLGQPQTLHFLRLPTKEDTIIASQIGRSLHRIPQQRAISFVHKESEQQWRIKKFDTETLKVSTIADAMPGREDIAWTPGGVLLSSDGNQLFALEGKTWKPIEVNSQAVKLRGITRLAVSADGKKLAVVMSEE
jgi:Tol biopolymer transport system component